jgi:hypothetical protein
LVFGWEWKGCEGEWKAFVSEEKGVNWGKKRWVHVCLEGHWHVNVDTGPKSLSWRAFACL